MYTSRSSHVHVRRDGEVHRHRPEEPPERRRVDVEGPHGVHDRLQHRVVGPSRVEIGEEAVAEIGERGGARFGGHVAAAL